MQELLIEELQPSECNLINESSSDGRFLWLTGICMQGSIKNRNGRVYPLQEIERAVESAKQRIAVSCGIFGELDHPNSLQINLDRVSHVITEMWMSGNDAYGKAKILETPMGNIAKELIKSGVKIGVSSRGAGNLLPNGEVKDFNYITYDLVATPSAPNAMPNSVYEHLEMSKKGKEIMTLSEAILEDKNAQKYFKREIQKWLSEGLFARR